MLQAEGGGGGGGGGGVEACCRLSVVVVVGYGSADGLRVADRLLGLGRIRLRPTWVACIKHCDTRSRRMTVCFKGVCNGLQVPLLLVFGGGNGREQRHRATVVERFVEGCYGSLRLAACC